MLYACVNTWNVPITPTTRLNRMVGDIIVMAT
jgi:hypothetical protein